MQLPRKTTKLEVEWSNQAIELFKSEKHGIMVVADTCPKMPLSCVVAAKTGTAGVDFPFHSLDYAVRLKLYIAADAMGEKIQALCGPDQKVFSRSSNFGIPDHPHIVMSAAREGEAQNAFTENILGPEVVLNTVERLRLTPDECAKLEGRLDMAVL